MGIVETSRTGNSRIPPADVDAVGNCQRTRRTAVGGRDSRMWRSESRANILPLSVALNARRRCLATTRETDRVIACLLLALLALKLRLVFLPPRWKALKQAEIVLCRLIHGHFVLELAPLLCKCTHALVDPFVAVDFGALLMSPRGRRRRRRNNRVNLGLRTRSTDVSRILL